MLNIVILNDDIQQLIFAHRIIHTAIPHLPASFIMVSVGEQI